MSDDRKMAAGKALRLLDIEDDMPNAKPWGDLRQERRDEYVRRAETILATAERIQDKMLEIADGR